MLSLDELERFVKRVEKMKAEGATTTEIAAAFGIPRSTLYMRLRRWKSIGV
jgi:transposase